jgi:hypothetical protein
MDAITTEREDIRGHIAAASQIVKVYLSAHRKQHGVLKML